MRIQVLGSVLLHGVIVMALVRLAPATVSKKDNVVTFDLVAPKLTAPKPEEPKPEEPTPPKPVEPTQPKIKASAKPTIAPETPQPAPPPQPAAPSVSAETPTEPPEQGSVLLPRRKPGVDLKLHSLPTGMVGGQLDGPVAKAAPKAEWKPKGTAGDPLLGKMDELKDDPFPLNKVSDGWEYKGPAFSAKIRLDGSVSFDDKNLRDFKGLSGSFDITELIMRGKKQDPYRREKEKFLAHVDPMREKLLKAAGQARLKYSFDSLKYSLDEVWSDTTAPSFERRATIYSMWKEAATTDKELAEAGKQAMGIVESFIRRKMPVGSPDAFTAEEMLRYNSAGRVPFDPYRSRAQQ